MYIMDASGHKQRIMGPFLKVDDNLFFHNTDLGSGIDKISKQVTRGRRSLGVRLKN